MQFGVIPSIAPYVLPKILPVLQRRYPDLQIELRETQRRFLIEELKRGALDVIMLALPANGAEIKSIRLFDDPFVLAVPTTDNRSERKRVSVHDIDMKRLLLLENGHCLRDQVLTFCSNSRHVSVGATSLATIMHMVANGYGITLVELRDKRVKLLRFSKPTPGRRVGLA